MLRTIRARLFARLFPEQAADLRRADLYRRALKLIALLEHTTGVHPSSLEAYEPAMVALVTLDAAETLR